MGAEATLNEDVAMELRQRCVTIGSHSFLGAGYGWQYDDETAGNVDQSVLLLVWQETSLVAAARKSYAGIFTTPRLLKCNVHGHQFP